MRIDYNDLGSEGAVHRDVTQWMLPGWPAIRIVLAEQPIAITPGERRYDPLPVGAVRADEAGDAGDEQRRCDDRVGIRSFC